MSRARIALVLFALLPLFASCASLDVDAMTTERTDFGTRHPGTVAVSVSGGSSGVKWFSGTVEPEELRTALCASIEKTALFAGLTEPSTADWLLDVRLIYAGSHPGFTMTGWVNAAWRLTARGAEVPVLNTEVQAEGQATTGEAFNGAKRQYLALERGGRANIDQGLAAIAALDLVAP